MSNAIGQFPHCDSRILHAPGVCEVCDRHPAWQELREVWNIAFTGNQPIEGQTTCPAMAARPEHYNTWGGNKAQPTESGEMAPNAPSVSDAELFNMCYPTGTPVVYNHQITATTFSEAFTLSDGRSYIYLDRYVNAVSLSDVKIPSSFAPNLGCRLAPRGWYCTRRPSHDGACAAYPTKFVE